MNGFWERGLNNGFNNLQRSSVEPIALKMTLRLFILASCLIALSVSDEGANLGRGIAIPILCAGEPIKLHLVDTIAKECHFELPKGRTAGKECPASCVQQKIGLMNDKFEVINNAEELANNLAKSGIYPSHAAKVAAEAIIKANCNEKIEHSRQCNDHLNFGDCVVTATLTACGLSVDAIAGYH
ncbi:unnamed protein product [Allacma fusca]|uniref:Uncharacterized protein n=1 Tax=Allacma fusca TaxID=39272 RepID=A0A8J2Q0Z6_9HEXA|nr:unnamed protein product [Allacma fusca]